MPDRKAFPEAYRFETDMEDNMQFDWIRSSGPDGEDRIRMYYKGRCKRADEGFVGRDVCARPVHLGPGEYTVVLSPDDCDFGPAKS